MIELLRMLEKDSTATHAQLASMLGKSEGEIREAIGAFEKEGVIARYRAVINWDKIDAEMVKAFIDIKVTPQEGEGFDRVAARIYNFDEVESMYLCSGGFDLSALVTGRSMKDVALFVAEKLAPLEAVTGTATHFILKRYKDGGVVFEQPQQQQERILMV